MIHTPDLPPLRRCTDQRLRQLHADHAQTSPGPWWAESGVVHAPIPHRPHGATWHPLSASWGMWRTDGPPRHDTFEHACANAHFAAEAHEAVPGMIEELLALRAALRAIRGVEVIDQSADAGHLLLLAEDAPVGEEA